MILVNERAARIIALSRNGEFARTEFIDGTAVWVAIEDLHLDTIQDLITELTSAMVA